MKLTLQKSIFVITLLLVLGTPFGTSAELDQTKIGVNAGDSFVFVVEKYYDSYDDDSDSGYYIGWDDETYESYYAKEGEEFTVTYNDISLDGPDSDGDYTISYEITYNNHTFNDEDYLDGIGRYIVSTDWPGQKELMEQEIAEVKNETEIDFDTFSADIIDTSSEFGVKFEYTVSEEENSGSFEGQIRYDKSTGVLNLEEIHTRGTEDGTEIKSDSILRRKGSGGSPDLNIPGFGFSLIFTTLFLSTIILVRNRRI
ncbi:MAG: hypothetical protein ACW99A_14960 [Candidatus Kariarchaeaceae archaeon]|jgi:hypothetical protein